MVGHRTIIEFDKEYLNRICNDEKACVSIAKIAKHLSLHPFHFIDVNESIKDILNQHIGKYKRDLGGIVLGYQNVCRMDNVLKSRDDEVYSFLEIKAEFFVFKPEIGQVLQGIVNKVGKDHIGCLVHRTFNVSLLRSDEDDEWCGNYLKVGFEVQFCITYTKLNERLPYLRGSFVSVVNGEDNCVDKNNKFLSQLHKQRRGGIENFESSEKTSRKIEVSSKYKKERKSKLKKEIKIENNWIEDSINNITLEENDISSKKIRKSKKKGISDDVNAVKKEFNDTSYIADGKASSEDVVHTKIKKSKKRKRDDNEDVEAIKSDHKKQKLLNDSLPDLNLNNLFLNGAHKKNQSCKSLSDRTFELAADSDLENILSNVSTHREKKLKKEPKNKHES